MHFKNAKSDPEQILLRSKVNKTTQETFIVDIVEIFFFEVKLFIPRNKLSRKVD